MKKFVYIVTFIDHLHNKREIVYVGSSYASSDSFCSNYSLENPEYKLSRNPKNKNHWIGESFNYNMKIDKKELDASF